MGHTEPTGPLRTFPFVGYTLRIPAAYLGGVPNPALGGNDAVHLLVWPPRLTPMTQAQRRGTGERFSSHVRLTIFGHEHRLHGQALLDAMDSLERYDQRGDERDEVGFRVMRGTAPLSPHSLQGEVHISPEGAEHLFACTPPNGPRIINPICTTQRWIGGSLRLEVVFRRVFVPDYLTMAASMERMMSCALDPAETASRAWPPLL